MEGNLHNEELTDKPRRETYSVELKIDESEGKCGEKDWRSKEIESKNVLEALSAAWLLEAQEEMFEIGD